MSGSSTEVTCGAAYRNESGLRNFCLIFHRYATSSTPSPVLSIFT